MEIKWLTEDSPDPMWYYVKGHVNKGLFMVEMWRKVKSGHFNDKVHPDCLPSMQWADSLDLNNFHHEWWHFFPQRKAGGIYARVDGPGRGNMPVTVLNVDYPIGHAEDVGLLLHG